MEKKTILVIGDNPLMPSGVGNQLRSITTTLLETGRYKVVALGGAIKHPDYQPIMTEEYKEDFIIYPVDGYGNHDIIRSVIRMHRPDALLMMTDPRFYYWLWSIDNEIRSLIPIVYYHVWDNYPYPTYNERWYRSCDVIAAISRVTDDIVSHVVPDVDRYHIPHAVNTEVFKPLPQEEKTALRENAFPDLKEDATVFFWNNRNARRKQPGTLMFWFKNFIKEVGEGEAVLVMHTEPTDPVGQNLEAILFHLKLTDGQILLSTNKVPPEELARIYNLADCTINISDAEGFGLSTLESLACGVPIIVNMTGGLQEQVTDGENWFGVGIEPEAKSIIGGQDIPFIYEDRIVEADFQRAIKAFYRMSKEERKALGQAGREHVLKNYNYDVYQQNWINLFDEVTEKYGSWETRRGYTSWKLESY